MIITISGRAGAGKDEVAGFMHSYFNRKYDDGVRITRFAYPLKAAAEAVFGKSFDNRDVKDVVRPVWMDDVIGAVEGCWATLELPSNNLDNDWVREVFRQHRSFTAQCYDLSPRTFQQLLGTDIVRRSYPNAFIDKVKSSSEDYNLTLVPDCRFDNELGVADRHVFVYRPNLAPVAEHISEKLGVALSNTYVEQCRVSVFPPDDVLQYGGRRFDVIDNYRDLNYLRDKSIFTAWEITNGK